MAAILGSQVNDDYETPDYAYKVLTVNLKNKIVWDPFFCTGRAKKKIEKNFKCVAINQNADFFDKSKRPKRYDAIVTNPPFSIMKRVIEDIVNLKKPYAILMRASHVDSKYFRDIMDKRQYTVVWPEKRIVYEVNGKKAGSPTFDSVWITNMKLKKIDGVLLLVKNISEINDCRF